MLDTVNVYCTETQLEIYPFEAAKSYKIAIIFMEMCINILYSLLPHK